MKTIKSKLESIVRNVFEDDAIVINETTSADDIDAWDSLMHVNLIVAVERAFEIRFTSREIARLKNLGELMQLIEQKDQ